MADELTGGDIFPTVVLPSDVEALQTAIRADYTQIREALIRCALADKFSPTLTPAEWDAWQSMKDRVEAYLAESPSLLGTKAQLSRGEELQKELATWHDKTKALGCDIATAPSPTAIPGSSSEASIFNFGTGIGAGMLILVLLMLWKGKL